MPIRHEVSEAFRIALRAIRANKARGVLTTLGIIIGVAGVSITMTAANGLSNNFKESVSAVGSDVLYVSRMPWIIQGNFFEFRNRPNVTLKDSEKLEANLRDAIAVNPSVNTQRSAKYRSETLSGINVLGTTEKQMIVSSSVPEIGRFLTASDVQYKRQVTVIGSTVKEELFGTGDPLNKTIRVGRSNFRVIGVMEKQGSAGFFGGPDFDSQIFVPITTFGKVFGSGRRNIDIAVKAPSTESLEDFEFQLTGEMRKIRKLKPTEGDNFSINKMDALVAMFNNIMGVVYLVGLIITSISLFVGGIGVMNIMFVSVTERTREIGIRKAIGAKKRAILSQFLLESSAICLTGGLLGLIVAFLITLVIDANVMPAELSLGIAFTAILVSLITGVIAGIIPAIKASRLNPIDALRYE